MLQISSRMTDQELCKFINIKQLKPSIVMIDRMMKELLQVRIKLIRRTANKAADWVASKYKEEVSLTNWVTRTPAPLVYILDKDGLLAPPN
ncbi:hypothetical protein GOBAR_DD34512 [Gossypium barbadense]|nr:hypothetical protein GOBAR_DD34512 [Gossypium barbadense]